MFTTDTDAFIYFYECIKQVTVRGLFLFYKDFIETPVINSYMYFLFKKVEVPDE